MSVVNADTSEVVKSYKKIKTAISSIEFTKKLISKKYQQLGVEWKDRKYYELGIVINDCYKTFNNILKTLHQGEKFLFSLIKYLNEYENVNLNRTYSSNSAAANTNFNSLTESQNSADIEQLINDYISDLKEQSEYPETISLDIDTTTWIKQSPESTSNMRNEFDNIKDSLINEWEKLHQIQWPTYSHDVYTHKGRLLHKAGDRYDAHHIHPLTFGGQNSAFNITPLHALFHYDKQGVHSPTGFYGRLLNSIRNEG
ncbi:MAG: hypothetical protein NC485_00315 [Ruminococcus flavefaciens]|nr:hypothetical protein [Ruminococcus flavefaciens]